MSTIVTRAGKGSPLTHTEVDNNFTNLNSDKYESGSNASFGTLAASGGLTLSSNNLTFSGTAQRIRGDFSNATVANRLMFQTSTTNGNTIVGAIPNGTGLNADFRSFNNSDLTNASFFQLGIANSGTEARLNSSITGTGTYLPMTFVTGGSERLRIDTSGNVGVGTSSPAYPLVVSSSVSTQIQIRAGNANDSVLLFGDTDSAAIGRITYSHASDSMRFFTNSSQAVHIDSSGNVGIGTNNPVGFASKLAVVGSSGLVRQTIASVGSTASDYGQLSISGGSTSVDSYAFGNGYTALVSTGTSFNVGTYLAYPTVFQTNAAERMRIDSSGNVGIGTSSPAARLDVNGAGIVRGFLTTTDAIKLGGNTSAPSSTDSFIYRPADNTLGFGTASAERMRLNSSGNLLVGTTGGTARIVAATDSSSGCIATVAQASSGVRYHIVFYENSTERGSVTSNGGGVSYNSISDYRLKENIAPLTGALAKVQALKPVTYTWKETGVESQGFIAHELQEVIPDAVVGEKDAVNADGSIKPQGIDTSFLVATLTAAIQEQQAIINDLKARIETLESK